MRISSVHDTRPPEAGLAWRTFAQGRMPCGADSPEGMEKDTDKLVLKYQPVTRVLRFGNFTVWLL